MLKLTYTLDVEDWKQFQKDHIDHSIKFRRRMMLFRVLIPLFMGSYPFLFVDFQMRAWWFQLIPFSPLFLFALIWLIYFPRFKKWQAGRRGAKMLAEGKNDKFFNEHHLEMTSSPQQADGVSI